MAAADSHPVETDWLPLHGATFRGRRCLVTGGAGFIGSHVADALVALGAQVRILDDLSEGDASNLPADAELVQVSLADAAACRQAAQGCELVFHLAAKVSVPGSVTDPVGYHDTNVTGTLNLLEAARAAGVRRVVYSASSSAYGDGPELPKHEEIVPQPMSPYAAGKLCGELYMQSHAAVYDLDTVCLRYFNIFGPRQNANSAYAGVIAAFARDLLAGAAPTIFGDGSASRDFTFVGNVVHANLLAARHASPLKGRVLNVGVGERVTVLELANAMARLLGKPDLVPTHAPPRPGDVAHSLADLSRTRQILGYEPIVDFDEGLQRTLVWYANRRQPAGAGAS